MLNHFNVVGIISHLTLFFILIAPFGVEKMSPNISVLPIKQYPTIVSLSLDVDRENHLPNTLLGKYFLLKYSG